MARTTDLTDTLEIVEEETNGSCVTVGEICESFNHRGFGSLLMVPALLIILIGVVPGIPAAGGVLICLITGQMIAGRRYPWLPGFLNRFSFSRKKLTGAIAWAKPYARFIDSFIRPRLNFFQHELAQRAVAIFCFILGMVMVFLGFIPFLPALLAIPVLFFGLGLSSRDGLMILAGFTFTLAAIVIMLWLSGNIGGGEDRLHIGKPEFVEQVSQSYDLDLLNTLSR